MADNVTQNIAIALYHYLCQNIVGTENHVKQIRLMNTVGDHLASMNGNVTFITSGSFGEGLKMRDSDLDIMYVLKDVEVHNVKSSSQQNTSYLTMDTYDVKPGFTQLYSENARRLFSINLEQLNGKHYLSSALFRQQNMFFKKMSITHGPCISDDQGRIDLAFCLHCKTWVSPATQWITRPSNQWPSNEMKQRIIEHGVLFVPIGVKGSPKEDLEWRISFSVCEKLLINTFTHTQFLCYALLKILLKDVIATGSECIDLLCSYFLKTIIFWISEELPQYTWKPNSLIPCFMRCVRRLIYCVKYSVCLHYFIPENNMFENKIEGRVCDILLEKLFTLHSYGWRCILFSDQISKFHELITNFHIEPRSLYVPEVVKIINAYQLQTLNHSITGIIQYSRAIRGIKTEVTKQIVSCQKSEIRYVYAYFMSKWHSFRAQSIPLTSTCSNKYQYKQYRSCLSTLQQNIYHDAVSGWLMIASFFYKTKQYNKALLIVEYSISKCTPEKLYSSMDLMDIHHRLLKLKTIQKKSIAQQRKIMLIDELRFEKDSVLIPNELLMLVKNQMIDELRLDEDFELIPNELHMLIKNRMCSTIVDSVPYAYFLKFICHYHLKHRRQCEDSLRDIRLGIAENNFIKSKHAKFSAYDLLGVAFKLFVDTESAQRAF